VDERLAMVSAVLGDRLKYVPDAMYIPKNLRRDLVEPGCAVNNSLNSV